MFPIKIIKGAAYFANFRFIARIGKQAAADDFKGFLGSDRFPYRFHPGEMFFQRRECILAKIAARFGIGFRQGCQQDCIRHGLECFRQRLHEFQIGFKRPGRQSLAILQFGKEFLQFINQHHAGRGLLQQRNQRILGGCGTGGIIGGNQLIALAARQLPRHFTPQGAGGNTVIVSFALGGGKIDAIQHGDARLRQCGNTGIIE